MAGEFEPETFQLGCQDVCCWTTAHTVNPTEDFRSAYTVEGTLTENVNGRIRANVDSTVIPLNNSPLRGWKQ